jgi:hypothetical protein
MKSEIEKLVEERNAEYQDAWRTTGEFMQQFTTALQNLLLNYPAMWFNLIMVFNKAIRILGNPTRIDSWTDIQGYAQLSIDYLRKEKYNEILSGRPKCD